MQHAVLQGRDSRVRFSSRFYRSLPPRPSDQRVSGKLELIRHAPAGMSIYAISPAASVGSFPLRYEGAVGGTLSDSPQLLALSSLLPTTVRALLFRETTSALSPGSARVELHTATYRYLLS